MHRPERSATQAHWDQMAADYDAAKQRNRTYYDALKGCFDQAVPMAARGRILEVGCGTGQILASLRPLNGVGIDVSERMIEAARRQFAGRTELTFAAMDAESGAARLGKLGGFDAVISADVMEHVADWRAVVDAMVSACRVGGVVAITTPNPRWAFAAVGIGEDEVEDARGPPLLCVSGRLIAHELAERRLRGPMAIDPFDAAAVLGGHGTADLQVGRARAASARAWRHPDHRGGEERELTNLSVRIS
jgi:SAM-dependent methyltransferase